MNHKSKMKPLWAVPAVAGASLGIFTAHAAPGPFPPDVINQLRTDSSTRIESQDVLAGDYGINGGYYKGDNGAKINITKFGGAGDIGDPMPIGNTGLAWQPQWGRIHRQHVCHSVWRRRSRLVRGQMELCPHDHGHVWPHLQ